MKEKLICQMAEYICETHQTLRQTAKVFGCSKSMVHNCVSNKLRFVNYGLYEETKKVLDENFAEKHLRGGESTRKKYLEKESEA